MTNLYRVVTSGVAVLGLCACGAQAQPSPTTSASLSPSAMSTSIADSDVLAFVRGDDIWLAQADGTHEHALTSHGGVASGLAWAPDGQSLAYVRDEHLWLIDASGNERLVSESVSAGYPSWSPTDLVSSQRAARGW